MRYEIICEICGKCHEMDSAYWVHSCIGFRPITDFKIIICKKVNVKNEY